MSIGIVTISATEAANPALTNFTPVLVSNGLKPSSLTTTLIFSVDFCVILILFWND